MIKILVSVCLGVLAAIALNYVAPMTALQQFTNLGTIAITGVRLAFLGGTVGGFLLQKKG